MGRSISGASDAARKNHSKHSEMRLLTLVYCELCHRDWQRLQDQRQKWATPKIAELSNKGGIAIIVLKWLNDRVCVDPLSPVPSWEELCRVRVKPKYLIV